MIEIQNTLVSLDLVERFFLCNLDACKGQCCLDGDAGAPLAPGEADRIREILPVIWDDLLPAGRKAIEEGGVSYIDIEGDEVTQLIEGGPMRLCYYRSGWFLALCYRECLPRGPMLVPQTRIMPPVPRATERIRGFYGCEPSSLENMQGGRNFRPCQGRKGI